MSGSHVTPDEARVRAEGKAVENPGASQPRAVALSAAEKRKGARVGQHEDKTKRAPRLPAKEIDLPTDPLGGRAVVLMEPSLSMTNEKAPMDDAPPPPPGWRYNLVGKLVPIEECRVPLTSQRGREMFLEVFEKTGSVRAALDVIGMRSVDGLQTAIATDPDFEVAYDVALERHRSRVYQAAHERAVEGYLVPIVGGREKDRIVAYERRYSDRLMEMFLKRHFVEFRDSSGTPKVVVNTQQNNVTGLDPTKMNKTQRDAYRRFLEAMGPADPGPVIEITDGDGE